MKEEVPRTWRKIHLITLAVVLAAGVILGSVVFPTIKEIPVDRIVEKEVIKRVEIPVEKIVEKRVEVPVDRVVEKRIEVPSDKAVIRYVSDRTKEINGKPSYVIGEDRLKLWMQIKPGMTRQQVVDVLGPPDGPPIEWYNSTVSFKWGNGNVYFESISKGGIVRSVSPPEY